MKQGKEVENLLEKTRYQFEDLVEITQILRSENGCPWDREQTHQTIRSCMIEETYEAVEAIDTENASLLREELGDVLFQVIFHAQIEAEQGVFDIENVIHDICVKMIRRHPHVFSNVSVSEAEEAIARWEQIKTEEKQRTTRAARLRAVPSMLPALMRAQKIVKKAGISENVSTEELRNRLHASVASFEATTSDETLGELLLSVAAVANGFDLDAERALAVATENVILQVEVAEGK